ncbi:hypothetical protein Bca52824_013531 [Brassica carinata]|uniref:Uncharacterized protein n=1 Tax=Brassica carinata TaxID=52824 RepID=A0A8X8B3H7_BRACI|nr:hypothetical protein Bca52824_013531 [Brassica carinata]
MIAEAGAVADVDVPAVPGAVDAETGAAANGDGVDIQFQGDDLSTREKTALTLQRLRLRLPTLEFHWRQLYKVTMKN